MNAHTERLKSLLEYHQKDQQNANLACQILDLYMQLGELDEAENFANSQKAMANSPGLRFRVAKLALARGDYGSALDILEDLLTSDVDNEAVRCTKAHALLGLRRPGDVAATLAPLAGIPAARKLLARSCQQLQDHATARVHLEQALAQASEDAETLGLLALACFDTGDPEAASGFAQRCLALEPGQLEGSLATAAVALNKFDPTAALAMLRPALERWPTSGAGWSWLAQAAMLQGDFTTAREALLRATQLIPEHIGTWHLLAWCEIVMNNLAAARGAFAKAYGIDRNFGETHGGLAVVSALEGKREEAEGAIRRAKRLAPQGFAAPFAESILMAAKGDKEGTKRIIHGLLTRDLMHGKNVLKLTSGTRVRTGSASALQQ